MNKLSVWSVAFLMALVLFPGVAGAQEPTRMDAVTSALFWTQDVGYSPSDVDGGIGLNAAVANVATGVDLVVGVGGTAGKADGTGTGQLRYNGSVGVCFMDRLVCPMFGYDQRTNSERWILKIGLIGGF